MMGSGSGGGRRIASSTRGGGGMSFPEVRQTKDILRYGRNTVIVQYKGGGDSKDPIALLRPNIFLKKIWKKF